MKEHKSGNSSENKHSNHHMSNHQNHNTSHEEHEHKTMNHDHSNHHEMMVHDFKKRFALSLLLVFPILLLSPMIQAFLGIDLGFTGDTYVLLVLSSILFVYGGKPFFIGAIEEVKSKLPAMMTLITLAIVVAYIYSTITVFTGLGSDFFWELSTLISVMLLGHWIEMKSILGASRALEELLKLMPETAHQIQSNGNIVDIALNQVTEGMNLLVKPGEKIPTDGSIYEGKSAINESMLTGESVPVEKSEGDEVIGGSINSDGSIKMTVTKVGEATFLSQVIKLVKDAQSTRSKTQRLADIAAKYLFYIALVGGIGTFVIWMSLGAELSFAMERAVTVIIISCPHALGLATPLVTAVSSSIGARHGLLIRNRANFENARKIDTVVFDKTGTLTYGKFGVNHVIAIKHDENKILSLAYALENHSEHPIAVGIISESKKRDINLLDVSNFTAIPGKGLSGTVDGKSIIIASPRYIQELDLSYDLKTYEKLADEGNTVIFVIESNILIGIIALADIVRESAIIAVKELKTLGIQSIMLTGDNSKVAHKVADEIGIDSVFSEVLPNQKADKIQQLVDEGHKVAMTGDGINDAPALAKSHLGIAIGAGTDVAIETADVILVKSNPNDVVSIVKLSKATYKKMIQNLIWATGYNLLAIPLAAGVLFSAGILLSPAIGAVLMSLSTIIVSINAKLLKLQ